MTDPVLQLGLDLSLPLDAVTQTMAILALGEFDPLPEGPDLFDHWLAQLPGPAARILEALVGNAGPMPKAELAAAAGYQPTGGGFNNPLGRLRTLGLVARGEPVALTPEFEEAIR